MSKLKAIKPEPVQKRLKMFVYGAAGVGKTTAAINFPQSYILDLEKGTDFYANTINKSNSVVLQTNNPDEIKDQIQALLVEAHEYKTLIIDPVTQLYNSIQEKWTRTFERYAKSEKEKEIQDFGMRYWGKVKSEFKSIQRLLLALDMNVIVTSHQKDVYSASMSKVGVTYDSMKGDDYFFDLIFRVERINGELHAFTVKERAEINERKFPDSFVWTYDNFCNFYGREIIEKESSPVILASKEQIEKMVKLAKLVNLQDEVINKWFTKANVDSWEEMTGECIQKCITFVEKQLQEVSEKI
jgi:hypothetical protein